MKRLGILLVMALFLTIGVSAECTDSDGGQNYEEKGTTIYTKNDNVISEVVDQCLDETRLEEYFCDPDGKTTLERYDCPEGCMDGACIGEEAEVEEVVEEETTEEIIEETAEIPPEETEEPVTTVTPSKSNTRLIVGLVIVVLLAGAVVCKKKFFKKKEK
ncbi:MAG: hypothetical protein KKA79_03490 [Nanoarchaeota archaeon]|nr:hypothetical protein [Nanoarchaeota archaeon]MCG2719087.1 hypothetical protein [Nanoarchaeota archaeon]